MTSNLRLAEIRLRNWKAYRGAILRLPPGEAGQVLVVSGQNGAGKTSLIEALALGLYGRDGVGLVARARDRRRGEASYDGFLERALNRDAGRDAMMSVELVFEGGPYTRIALERVWYFSATGRHERDDEDVRIREGEDEDLLPLPAQDREAFIRAYVAEALLPVHMASFFIFDGEHVDRLAGLDLEGQVRSAVEAMLGVPLLRQTIQDLRTYARERRRESHEAVGSDLSGLKERVSALESREDLLRSVVETYNEQLAPLRIERDVLVARIGSLHGDSYASFKGLFEAREKLSRDRAEKQEDLRRALSVDLAFALAGDGLKRSVQARLAAETLRERWIAGLRTSDERYTAFVSRLETPLTQPQVLEQLRAAWESVWNESPEGCAAELRHNHLGDAERNLVASHLDQVSRAAGERISVLSREVDAMDQQVQKLEARIAQQNGVDEISQSLAAELRRIQEEIATLDAKHLAGADALDGLRQELSPLKLDLARKLERHANTAPVLRRADRAERYAAVLEEVIETAVPERMVALSEAVSKAYRGLAHKVEVERIEISAMGDVRLIDVRGEDMRSRDASAGETQIFALALMAAIAASAPVFPIIMDTPFARLDPKHRRNVLRYFTQLGPQLILLAHPAEIAADDLAELGSRLSPPVEVSQDAGGVSRLGGGTHDIGGGRWH